MGSLPRFGVVEWNFCPVLVTHTLGTITSSNTILFTTVSNLWKSLETESRDPVILATDAVTRNYWW